MSNPLTSPARFSLAAMRISLGLIFIWAFFDKLIGLGYSTCRDATTDVVTIMCSNAWLAGGSPTMGFLKFGTSGPFADFYQSIAGNMVVDWIFMIGLFGIGLGLILGIAMRLATVGGAAMMILMWSATLWPTTHPVLDDHIIYALALLVLLATNNHQILGLGQWWNSKGLGSKLKALQ